MPSEDSKPLKMKEELQEDDEDEMPISAVRNKTKKPSNSPATSTPKQKPKAPKREVELEDSTDNGRPLKKPSKPTLKSTKPKKEEDDLVDFKKIQPKDDKKKIKKEEVVVKVEVKKKEKKVYDLPGQKRDPPEEREPLRIFYESLYQQKPTSELAAIWMMESGLLPLKDATLVYEKKMKKSKNQKVTSPLKPVKTVKETNSVTVKKKVVGSTPNSSDKKKKMETTTVTKRTIKRKAESSEEDPTSSEDEFVLSARKKVKKARIS